MAWQISESKDEHDEISDVSGTNLGFEIVGHQRGLEDPAPMGINISATSEVSIDAWFKDSFTNRGELTPLAKK